MFTWWISWLWVYLLWASWACVEVGDGAAWAARFRQYELVDSVNGLGVDAEEVAEAGTGAASGAFNEVFETGGPDDILTAVDGPQGGVGPGMGGSAVERLGIEGAQFFATQPIPQTAVVGSTVVLPCRVINKVGHLQWTKNGFGLGTERGLYGFSRYKMIGTNDEGDFSLKIEPVLLEDDALYQCQVSASAGVPGIRSRTARLTVFMPPDPPRVKPAILNTTAGMTVTVECESRGGRPPPEILWIDDLLREPIRAGTMLAKEVMSDGKRVTVRSRLSFTPRRAHHNSTLSCQTSNQALNSPLKNSIQLRVYFPPDVRLVVQPETMIEADDVTFTCDAEANPDTLTYSWFHNENPLPDETSRSLTLYKISRDLHGDEISCEVSNKVGTSKKTQNIQIQYGPRFRFLPRNVAAEIGNEVVLKCDVDSNPSSSIVWHQDGLEKVIGRGRELRVVVSPSTAGGYKCVAAVRGFPDLQGRLRVLVKGPPQIVSSSEQQGRMGDTVTLECSTVSIPSPIRVTWTYRGREIDVSDPRYEVVEDQQEAGLRNILVIHDADSHDFGAYNCSVVNEYGVARKMIRLNEEKRVPVLLLVGGVVAVVVVAVVVVSLVLCNKRHSTIKDPPGSERAPAVNLVPATPVSNMCSATSDTRHTEELTLTPNATPKASPTPSRHTYEEYKPMKLTRAGPYRPFNLSESDNEGGRGYVSNSWRNYVQTNGRRASFSSSPEFCTIRRSPRSPKDMSMRGQDLISLGPNMTESGQDLSDSGQDISNTIHENTRNQDIVSRDITTSRNTLANSGQDLPNIGQQKIVRCQTLTRDKGLSPKDRDLDTRTKELNSRVQDLTNKIQDLTSRHQELTSKNQDMSLGNSKKGILGGTNYQETSTLRHNGVAHIMSRHPGYSGVQTKYYGSPPLSRTNKFRSPRRLTTSSAAFSKSLDSEMYAEDWEPPTKEVKETKYIFSTEAMMKPGTHV